MPTLHLLIKGKVQGVFFRATAKEIADELGLSGWVKNTKEGYVEAVASGTQQQLDRFVAWCKQGPEKADVKNVAVTEIEEITFSSFKIIR